MIDPFSRRLFERILARGTHLCIGFDPRPEMLPAEFAPSSGTRRDRARAALAFGREVLEIAADHAAAWKPQSAFFEVLGPPGLEAYEELARNAGALGLLRIADVKRGDIGSTAEAYAAAAFGVEAPDAPLFDAVTVNPWFGSDGLEPFFDTAARVGGAVFVLVKTSNPSSSEIQDLVIAGGAERLCERLASRVASWSEDYPEAAIAAVVGATHPERLRGLRALMPANWLLLPGVGAQGATMRDAAQAAAADAPRLLVNLSRGICSPWGAAAAPPDWRAQVERAAERAKSELRAALGVPSS